MFLRRYLQDVPKMIVIALLICSSNARGDDKKTSGPDSISTKKRNDLVTILDGFLAGANANASLATLLTSGKPAHVEILLRGGRGATNSANPGASSDEMDSEAIQKLLAATSPESIQALIALLPGGIEGLALLLGSPATTPTQIQILLGSLGSFSSLSGTTLNTRKSAGIGAAVLGVTQTGH